MPSFGRRGFVVAAPVPAPPRGTDAAECAGNRITLPTVMRALKILFIVSMIASSLAWEFENIYFIRHASDRAQRLCAGKTGLLDGPNSYYWCLQRVEAGGKP